MLQRFGAIFLALLLTSCAGRAEKPPTDYFGGMEWLAGDHHVHSHYSVGWRFKGEPSQSLPPLAQIGGDAINPIEKNAKEALAHGLDWMVTTDHGGPFHSNIHLEQAYPDVLDMRDTMPGFFLFYGMEFDTPGADHASLIMPFSPEEADHLFYLERNYNKREPFPAPPEADQEPRMNAAVTAMAALDPQPILIVNHISRSKVDGVYGKVTPTELRRWNDLAPSVVVGMEGSPGHQARSVRPDGTTEPTAPRGGYEDEPTYGGFDAMTAQLGGFWDSMLGDGRRWWITATSDMHRHWRKGGDEFWPGEYSKTYVLAERSYASILHSIREGRMFAVTGDLISGIRLEARSASHEVGATLGETVFVRTGEDVSVTFAFQAPGGPNFNGDRPDVSRVDVIVGDINPGAYQPEDDAHPTASVAFRLYQEDFTPEPNGWFTTRITLPAVTHPFYIRVRGTSGNELEPLADPPGENPWADLWFYTNPVFVSLDPE